EMPAVDPSLARDILAQDTRASGAIDADDTATRGAAVGKDGKRSRKPVRPDGATGDLFVNEAMADDDSRALDAMDDDLPATSLLSAPPPRREDAGREALDVAGAKL